MLPPFAEGDEVVVAAGGSYFGPFSLTAHGIAALSVGSDSLALSADTDLAIVWEPAMSDLSTVHIKLDVSHHGGTKGKIECDAADDGQMEISAQLVSELMSLGVSGYPTIVVTRQQVSATTIEVGTVELVVSSRLEIPVEIAGLLSCTDDSQCPEGQTCESDLTCQ